MYLIIQSQKRKREEIADSDNVDEVFDVEAIRAMRKAKVRVIIAIDFSNLNLVPKRPEEWSISLNGLDTLQIKIAGSMKSVSY